MGESFQRGDREVWFSSGALESVYRALIALGERAPAPDADTEAVVAWLRRALVARGPGGRAFSLTRWPADLAADGRRVALARLLGALAAELGREPVDRALLDVDFDRDLRLEWLWRIVELHDLVAEAPLALALPAPDAAECELRRLLFAYARLSRRDPPIDACVTAIARIDERARAAGLAAAYAAKLASLHMDAAEALDHAGRPAEALAAARRALALEPDPELRRLIGDFVLALGG